MPACCSPQAKATKGPAREGYQPLPGSADADVESATTATATAASALGQNGSQGQNGAAAAAGTQGAAVGGAGGGEKKQEEEEKEGHSWLSLFWEACVYVWPEDRLLQVRVQACDLTVSQGMVFVL